MTLSKKTYKIEEAKELGLDKIAKIQKLDREIDANRELRDDFLQEDDTEMANEMQNDITADEIRKGELIDSLTEEQKAILDECKIHWQPGDGSYNFYSVDSK